jgi:cytochrome c oxidase subunit II
VRPLVAIGLPPDASADGWRIDALFTLVAWQAAVLAAVVIGWLAVILLRHRGGPPRHDHGTSRRGRLIPIALTTVVFLAVDGALFIGSTRDLRAVFLRDDDAEREPGAVRVEVNGHQWSWAFRLPGPDEAFGTADDVVTLDHLVLPRGRAVVLEVSSTDVVHALYLPAFRVKLDAVPGRVSRTWFRPAKLGRFEIGCAQFCGVSHYQMRGVLEVVEPDDFERFVAREAADALRIDAEDRRALEDEPDRPLDPLWPRFSPIEPATARDWAWPWGQR